MIKTLPRPQVRFNCYDQEK